MKKIRKYGVERMTIVNWIIATITGLIGILCVCANWFGLIRWLICKKNYSQIMFIGGILLCVSLYNTPLNHHCYFGLLVDPGVWIGIYSLPSLFKGIRK